MIFLFVAQCSISILTASLLRNWLDTSSRRTYTPRQLPLQTLASCQGWKAMQESWVIDNISSYVPLYVDCRNWDNLCNRLISVGLCTNSICRHEMHDAFSSFLVLSGVYTGTSKYQRIIVSYNNIKLGTDSAYCNIIRWEDSAPSYQMM